MGENGKHFYQFFKQILESFIQVIEKEYENKEENSCRSFNLCNQQNSICDVPPLENKAEINQKMYLDHINRINSRSWHLIHSPEIYFHLLKTQQTIEEFIRISTFEELTLPKNRVIIFDDLRTQLNNLTTILNDEAKMILDNFNILFGEIDFEKIKSDLKDKILAYMRKYNDLFKRPLLNEHLTKLNNLDIKNNLDCFLLIELVYYHSFLTDTDKSASVIYRNFKIRQNVNSSKNDQNEVAQFFKLLYLNDKNLNTAKLIATHNKRIENDWSKKCPYNLITLKSLIEDDIRNSQIRFLHNIETIKREPEGYTILSNLMEEYKKINTALACVSNPGKVTETGEANYTVNREDAERIAQLALYFVDHGGYSGIFEQARKSKLSINLSDSLDSLDSSDLEEQLSAKYRDDFISFFGEYNAVEAEALLQPPTPLQAHGMFSGSHDHDSESEDDSPAPLSRKNTLPSL